MTSRKKSRTLGLIVLATLASPAALAQESSWYLGGNLGRTKATINDANTATSLLGPGFIITSLSRDNRDSGYKLFAGYQFSPNLAFEGGFFDLGKFSFGAGTSPLGSIGGTTKLRGMNLDLVGRLPITDNFSVFGRIGLNRAEAKGSFNATGLARVNNSSPSKSDTNLKAGLGLQYDFDRHFSVRAEAERYRINDSLGNKGDIDMLSIGLVYRFGAPRRAASWTPPAPAPVTYTPPAPMPEPVAVAPPPATYTPPQPAVVPSPLRVTFSADALFDFDRAVIRPAGAAELDKFARDLSGTRFGTISVTGHTDRLGSSDYNQRLSTRRAEAVKTYLVQNGRIPADAISATGMTESSPVTKPGDCTGKTANASLIACLQPDRRVVVEVSGTR